MSAVGSTMNVLVCQPVATGEQTSAVDQQVCPAAGGQFFKLQSVQAYVLDPASASMFEAMARPLDYAAAGALWSWAFAMVVGLYVVSAHAGAVLGFIRRG